MTAHDKKPFVRPYRADDESAVRRICFETALYGQPIAALCNDPVLVSDALVGPYIRILPEHLFVAEIGRDVAGYLAGCLNAARLDGYYRRALAGTLIRRFLVARHWTRRASWRFAWYAALHANRVQSLAQPLLKEFPAHLHINADARYQRQGLGSALLQRFELDVRAAGVPGIHASTSTDAGRRFFALHGFHPLAHATAPSLASGQPVHLTLMGKRLSSH